MPGQHRRRPRPGGFGRLAARILCALFALIGALPLAAGLLVRSQWVLRWAARETARVLEAELGLAASYRVELKLWPLAVSLHDLEVPASDGGEPALRAARVSVTPRIFALLGGQLDVGEVEIESPRARLIVRDGKLANVRYRLPERSARPSRTRRAPFSSLAVNEARLALDIDGTSIETGAIDLDVYAEPGPAFEVALRVGRSSIVRERDRLELDARGRAVDEDVACRVDARLRWEQKALQVRRLSLIGALDGDPARGTQPECRLSEDDDPRRVALSVSRVRVELGDEAPPVVDGHLGAARAPMDLLNRFVRMGPLRGWIAVSGDARWDGSTRLPQGSFKLSGDGIGMERYHFADDLAGQVRLERDRVKIGKLELGYADGRLTLSDAEIRPFAPKVPLTARRVDGRGVTFPGLMRDIGVTRDTIVRWDQDRVVVTKFGGTLSPLELDGELQAETSDFEVTNRAWHDARRVHIIGVRHASLRGRIGVRPGAFELYETRADFGKSSLVASVSIGFHNDIRLEVHKGSKLELRDASPLVDIEMAGLADLELQMAGKSGDPLLTGTLAIRDFHFGGFPIGTLESGRVRFRPLFVELSDVRGRKGKSAFQVPTARLDFEAGGTLIADAHVRSADLDLRDFLAMWHFDDDPRFDPILGRAAVDARVHYDLDGPKDRCGDGWLSVAGTADLWSLDLFEEKYDDGKARFDFRWADRRASYLGFDLDVPSFTLTKGGGSALGSLSVRQGAVVRAHAVASGIALSRVQSLGGVGALLEGKGSGVVEVAGTIDDLVADASLRIGPVRVGSGSLPASEMSVHLEPIRRPQRFLGKTRCGRPIPAEFERADFDADRPAGTFHVAGKLFGGQVRFDDLAVTRQRKKHARGGIDLVQLDVGALADLGGPVLGESRPSGRLTGRLDIRELALDRPSAAEASALVSSLRVRRGGLQVDVRGARPMSVAGGRLEIPGLELGLRTPKGKQARFDLDGSVAELGATPRIDARLRMRETELAAFLAGMPRVERTRGKLRGELRVTGTPAALGWGGGFELRDGEVALRGLPAPLTDIDVAITVDRDEIRIARGTARLGDGTLALGGTAKLAGFELANARATLALRSLSLPLVDGVDATVDADLIATFAPGSETDGPVLPRVTGDVTIERFSYTRPIVMTADLSSLAQRGKRTEFELYDPDDDFVELDVTLRARRPLEIRNNLVDAELVVGDEGLVLGGTNQRFGLRGDVRLKQGGRIRMRRSEFEVAEGKVRFDDTTRIAPEVDVTATTEYRRYSDASTEVSGGKTPAGEGGGASAQGGRWRITMHAHGDADRLRIDLTSDPSLAQDDIFLLLTIGLTRAELDQAQSASVGESVALEALGTLSGADQAVTEALPVIDDFRFGSAYSSRTGRTEPTVTVGKRLAERIRAAVTSGLGESREIRSNVEWRLSPRVSLEGSYDNVNDISSSSVGNLGADVRWSLEFE